MASQFALLNGEVVEADDLFGVIGFVILTTKDWDPEKRLALLRDVQAMFEGAPTGVEVVVEPQGLVALAAPALLDLLRMRGAIPAYNPRSI